MLSLSADFKRDAEETRATSFIIGSACSIAMFPRVPPWARYVGTESARGWALRQHSDEGAVRGRGGTPQSLNAAGRRAEPGGGAAGAWLQWSRTRSCLAGELRSYAMRELTPAGGSEQRLAYSKRSINAGSSGFL